MAIKEDAAEKMYPEGSSMKMAMDQVFIANGPKLRDQFQWTEQQLAEFQKVHTEALTGVVLPHEAGSVHDAITTALRNPPITDGDVEARQRRTEQQRVETMQKGREEYKWAWDRIFAKAKEMVGAQPKFRALIEQAGLDNDYRVWAPVFRRAKQQLKKEGKL